MLCLVAFLGFGVYMYVGAVNMIGRSRGYVLQSDKMALEHGNQHALIARTLPNAHMHMHMHSQSILYEESVRVPLLMRFPKHIPAGLVRHSLSRRDCHLLDGRSIS